MPYILLNIFQSRPLLSINHPKMEFQANLIFADDEELDFASNCCKYIPSIDHSNQKIFIFFLQYDLIYTQCVCNEKKKRLLELSEKLGYKQRIQRKRK